MLRSPDDPVPTSGTASSFRAIRAQKRAGRAHCRSFAPHRGAQLPKTAAISPEICLTQGARKANLASHHLRYAISEYGGERPVDTAEQILRESTVIAVVGLSDRPDRPSHGVARYMQEHGYRIIPVNPKLTGPVLGEQPYSKPGGRAGACRRGGHIQESGGCAARRGRGHPHRGLRRVDATGDIPRRGWSKGGSRGPARCHGQVPGHRAPPDEGSVSTERRRHKRGCVRRRRESSS